MAVPPGFFFSSLPCGFRGVISTEGILTPAKYPMEKPLSLSGQEKFTDVNKHFWGEHNADIGHYGQTLNKKQNNTCYTQNRAKYLTRANPVFKEYNGRRDNKDRDHGHNGRSHSGMGIFHSNKRK